MGSIIKIQTFNSNMRGHDCNIKVKIKLDNYDVDANESLTWESGGQVLVITYDAYPSNGSNSQFIDWVSWVRKNNERWVVVRVFDQGSSLIEEAIHLASGELEREVVEHDEGGNS